MRSFHTLRTCLVLTVTCTSFALFAPVAMAECDSDHCKHRKHDTPAYSDLDADGNGTVNAEEFQTFRANRMAKRAAEGGKMKHAGEAPSFEDLDLDGDGNLSEDEFAEHKAQCPMCAGKHKDKHKNKDKAED